jgi:drug/metabolite transporter (DMT)-like permease
MRGGQAIPLGGVEYSRPPCRRGHTVRCRSSTQTLHSAGSIYAASRGPSGIWGRTTRGVVDLHWLLPAAFLSFGFGQLFKWSQRRGCHAPTVVSLNYLTLAAILAVWHVATGRPFVQATSWLVGGSMGAAFLLAMLTMTAGLERAPVGMVLTSFRLAVVVPVAISVWLWGESLRIVQAAGIGLTLVALVMITSSRAPGRISPLGATSLLLGVAVFLTQGLGGVCLRWVHYAGLDEVRLTVLMTCAATAGIAGAVVVATGSRRPGRRDIGMGVGIGVYNLICLATILTALRDLEGTLFFPVTACLVVLMDALVAHLWWHEHLGRLGIAGAALGALALLLVL